LLESLAPGLAAPAASSSGGCAWVGGADDCLPPALLVLGGGLAGWRLQQVGRLVGWPHEQRPVVWLSAGWLAALPAGQQSSGQQQQLQPAGARLPAGQQPLGVV